MSVVTILTFSASMVYVYGDMYMDRQSDRDFSRLGWFRRSCIFFLVPLVASISIEVSSLIV